MAKGDKSNRTCKLTLRQELATDKYGNQTLNHINPSVTDDKFLYFGNKLSALTDKTLNKVIRTDSYDIAAE
jgi:hypothetical protein